MNKRIAVRFGTQGWLRVGRLGALICALAVVMSGCGGAPALPPSDTPMPAPTDTPTSVPTSTPLPTATSTPVLTPIPTGDPAVCERAGGCATFKPGEPVKIGVAAQMSGYYANYGLDTAQAAQIALDDAGPFHDYPLALVQADDQANANTASVVALDLASDPAVVAVVGPTISDIAKRTMPIYAGKFIPLMSLATAADLTQLGNPAFNRVVSTDKLQSDVGAQFVAQNLGLKKVAILYDGNPWDPYPRVIAAGVRSGLQRAGVTVVAYEAFEALSSDYTPLLKRIAALQPDGIYFCGYSPDAVTMVMQMQASDIQAAFIGGVTLMDGQFLSSVGEYSEGIYAVGMGAPFSDERQKFDDAYLAEFGQQAGSRTPFVWPAYDATRVLIEAIKSVAFQSDGVLYIPRKALMDAVRHTKDYQGLTGVITCSANGECATAPTYFVFQVKSGQFVQLPPDYRP